MSLQITIEKRPQERSGEGMPVPVAANENANARQATKNGIAPQPYIYIF
jgi:hypothetical protein